MNNREILFYDHLGGCASDEELDALKKHQSE